MMAAIENIRISQRQSCSREATVIAQKCKWQYLKKYHLIAGLAIILLPGMPMASGHDIYPGDTAIYRSITPNIHSNVLRVTDDSRDGVKPKSKDTLYIPSITYPGIYETNRLYRMSFDSTSWVGSKHPAFLKEVTCSDARKRLSQSGSWTGLLMKDGACGMNSEPSEWALGNLLNYQAGISTTSEPEMP